uniref:Putative salt tolerance-like protein At1g78600 n=1 Tax=Anthurium amnicola TaxID=1678845 RepID=A0A1D1YXI0_9ARAE
MKVQCDVCERAEATVLCCADEAALCDRCDDKVHAANKLAGKHQRVPLLSRSASHNPSCDICQEKAGYFFCLEDRALLCRHCDVAIHTATPYVSSHRRFLVTGVRVALQHHLSGSSAAAATSSSSPNNHSASSNSNRPCYSSMTSTSHSSPEKRRRPAPPPAPVGFAGVEEVDGFRAQWLWDEFIPGDAEFGACCGLASGPGSSRVDSH